MGYEDLTPEQREMAKNCSTPEELLELSRKIGYKLSVDELDAVSGGASNSWSCWEYECPPDCRMNCDPFPHDSLFHIGSERRQ